MIDQEKEIKTVLKSSKKHNNKFKLGYVLVVALGYLTWVILFIVGVRLIYLQDYFLGIFMLFIILVFNIDDCIIKQLFKMFGIDE